MKLAALCASAFVATLVLTGAYRAYALRRGVLDVPNARSSHQVPTPRGGGVAFVVAFLAAFCAVPSAFSADGGTLTAVLGAGGAMALLGFVDDHGHIPAGWRLLGHFAASAWALYWLGPGWIPEFFGVGLAHQAAGYAISALGIVWLLNLFNFMDGIDGIAGVETITASLGAAGLWFLANPSGSWSAPLLLAASTTGFLVWNFPPARIFMGDAGSNFLGITLAILAMRAAADSSRLLWAWGILLGVFIVDATVTLFRRLARRERVHQAHRTHAYQYAARKHGHRPVTLATGALTGVYLLPVAAAVATGRLPGVLGVGLAYAPLVALALRYGAGTPERAGPPDH